MNETGEWRDAGSALVSYSWTIAKCGDIKRSLSTRAHNNRRDHDLSDTELRQMACLYAAVHGVDCLLRSEQGTVKAADVPQWVLRHV